MVPEWAPMYSLLLSTLAYPIIAWWLHRRLEEWLEPGMVRRMLVFLLASIACWGLASVIDWAFPGQALHLL